MGWPGRPQGTLRAPDRVAVNRKGRRSHPTRMRLATDSDRAEG